MCLLDGIDTRGRRHTRKKVVGNKATARALATEPSDLPCLFAEKEEQRKGVNDDFHKDKKKIVAN